MRKFALQFFTVLCLFCLLACSHRAKRAAEAPAATKPQRQIERFTGEVIHTPDGYRFRPLDGKENLRLTRARRGNNYESEEIHIRKYFGKILVVRGDAGEGWILEAVVLGQWLRPGEKSGPNVEGPKN